LAKHRAILKAAIELLEAKGIAAMTIEEVAVRAGVAKTTIYRRWSTKGALAIEGFLYEMSTRMFYDNSSSVIDDLKSQLRRVATTFKSPTGRVISGLIAEAQRDPETMNAFLEGYILRRRGITRQLLQRGVENGELKPNVNLDMITDLLYAPMYYRLLMNLGVYGADDIERYVDIVVAGLNATGADPSSLRRRRDKRADPQDRTSNEAQKRESVPSLLPDAAKPSIAR
jgi:AcrR family transcriptional regulator